MRSSGSPVDFLIAVAKKKPQLQALIDNVFTTSYEEIDTLDQPLWVRQALRKYKETEGNSPNMYAMARLAQVIAAEEAAALIPPATYEVRIWDSTPGFVGTLPGYNSSWQIEVDTGDSLLLFDDGKVRFGDSVLQVCEEMRYPLMLNTKFVGYMTLENYKGFHRALLNQKHKLL